MTYMLSNIEMKNYMVAASSPLTESVERLICCYEAGFSAAILKSASNYIRTGEGYGRKIVYISDGYYADSSFEREILTIEEGLRLFCSAKQKCPPDMLLIPSVSASSLDPGVWLDSCDRFVVMGAQIIQLDFFYLGNLEHNYVFYDKFKRLLTSLVGSLNCIIMPKLNINFEPNKVCEILSDCGVEVISLLDSIREVPDLKYGLHPDTTSYFGKRQFPETLRYLKAAKLHGLQVCAGGGVTSYNDVVKLLEEGASMVQVASYILNRSFNALRDLLPNEDFTGKDVALLSHNPWCDYKSRNNCEMCNACVHII